MGKSILLFVLLSVAVLHNIVCQTTTSLYVPSCAYSSDQAIGRVSSDGSHIISYHYHSTYGEFVWPDLGTNNCHKFNLQDNIFVYDFERMGDTVFFCGYNKSIAIVGFFTESVFTSGSGNVFYAKVPETGCLNKMEVYSDPNTQNPVVAAVGQNGIDTNQFITTSIFVFEFSGGNVTYKHKDYSMFWQNRIYQDIAVTDNYIVAVGICNFASNQIALTTIDKKNTLFYNRYIPIEIAGNMNSINYSIEYLQDDEVAISSLVDNPSTPSIFVSPVHVFDAASATFVNSQTVPLLQKSAPYNEMKYFPDNQTLLLLQTNDYPVLFTTNSVFYYLDPYTTIPYNALTVFDNSSYYYSLDRFAKYSVLATGELKALSHSFLMHDITALPQFKCLDGDYNTVTPINTPLNNPLPYDSLNDSNSFLTSFQVYTTVHGAKTMCNE